MRRHVLNWRGAITACLAAAAACRSGQATRKPAATPVRVTPASTIDAPVTVSASGVVEPMQTVAVTTQVTGSLLSVLFKEGDFVQKGQALFRIDPRPLQAAADQASANLARDMAQAAAAKKDDERYASLANIGYVSKSQSDQMHANAQATAATVDADRAALRAAQVNLGFTSIRAPIAGKTGALLVRPGNNVSPSGGPLVVINQLSPVLVRFPVLEQDFAPMQTALAGHPLPVVATSNDSTQPTEHGVLAFLDNNVDSLTGSVTGKASFPNADKSLWPGELVFLTVQLRVEHGVVAVPTDAILTGQQGPYVFVIDAGNAARMRPIVPGIQLAELTVVQKGLTAGERVVVDGQSRLNAGTRVAITGFGTDTSAATLGGVDSSGNGRTVGGDVMPGNANGSANGGRGAVAGSAGTPSPAAAVGSRPSPQQPATQPSANGTTPSNGNASPNSGSSPAQTNPATTPTQPSSPTSPLTTPPAQRPLARPPAPTPSTAARGRPPGGA